MEHNDSYHDRAYKALLEAIERRNNDNVCILSLFGAAFLILIIVNLALGIKWMNSPLLLDECTLFTLLICLCQDMIVNILYLIITR